MRLETVKLVVGDSNTWTNFRSSIEPLYYFDCMINGSQMDDSSPPKITNKHCQLLSNLITWRLDESKKDITDRISPYIINTFATFCDRKKSIFINLCFVDKWFAKIKDLIFTSSESTKYLLSNGIFRLFPNIEMCLYTYEYHFATYWRLINPK